MCAAASCVNGGWLTDDSARIYYRRSIKHVYIYNTNIYIYIHIYSLIYLDVLHPCWLARARTSIYLILSLILFVRYILFAQYPANLHVIVNLMYISYTYVHIHTQTHAHAIHRYIDISICENVKEHMFLFRENRSSADCTFIRISLFALRSRRVENTGDYWSKQGSQINSVCRPKASPFFPRLKRAIFVGEKNQPNMYFLRSAITNTVIIIHDRRQHLLS